MNFDNNLLQDEYTIRTSTKELGATAAHLKSVCKEIYDRLNSIDGIISSSSSYWLSDSGDMLRNLYNDDKEDIVAVSQRLEKRLINLDKIISLYDSAEDLTLRETQFLPGKLID